jgi:hypothetical protein
MSVAEAEHAAVSADQPVPAAIGCRSHGNDGCVDLLALRPEETCVAEGQHRPRSCSFVPHEVRGALAQWSRPRDRVAVYGDKRHERHYDNSRSSGTSCREKAQQALSWPRVQSDLPERTRSAGAVRALSGLAALLGAWGSSRGMARERTSKAGHAQQNVPGLQPHASPHLLGRSLVTMESGALAVV